MKYDDIISVDLCTEAKEYMKDIINALQETKVIENIDRAALKMLAVNYDMFINAMNEAKENGYTTVNSKGVPIENPAVSVAFKAQRAAVKLLKEFGLTSASRKKLNSGELEEQDSELMKFLMGDD